MSIPLLQKVRVGAYIMRQHLSGNKRYPLALMLEPLFRCNLACNGCGKIDYPDPILNQRLSLAECLEAVDECGAPVVSIAGGEPLLHKEMPQVVKGIIARKKFVYLCTNALLMEKKMDDYEPNPYFVWSVHLDGDQTMHDHSVSQEGVYDKAVAAIREAKRRGFRVNINCTLFNDAVPERVAAFFDTLGPMGVDGITVSPGYAYERAPDQQHFLNRDKTKHLFREIFKRGNNGKNWSFSQSAMFLDFLAGNQTYHCTPWGQSGANGVRLAASVLSGRRRLCEDLQGTDGHHRLGRIRHRQLRKVRGLHGAQRLRGDRRNGYSRTSAEGAEDQLERSENDGCILERHPARQTASGRIRVLAPRRDQAGRDRPYGQRQEGGNSCGGELTGRLSRHAGIEKTATAFTVAVFFFTLQLCFV